jgi:acetyl esterase/lipase
LQDRARAEGGSLGRGGVSARRIVVAGRSLGGAVAIALCAKLQDANGLGDLGVSSAPAALVVENTFTSISDMVRVGTASGLCAR